jgi:DNA-binding ferritin-like protein
MKELIVTLLVIKSMAKQLHYQASGLGFWSDHKLADEIADRLDDFIDEANELILSAEEAPLQKQILMAASEAIPEVITWNLLYNVISEYLTTPISGLAEGYNDLLARVANDLQHKLGFIRRRLL